ncbi:hypothetical protein J5N97_007800 [Dioscorea zingiberensis]|uniref:Cytochrome P450 n=1 Tax=Dioscorea zingiberensis TaxID=325984 RepID=A0A9D5DD76_9LILI|nr:hypothetical protein J5N97_007800 [Dioscorea zingiberensis]
MIEHLRLSDVAAALVLLFASRALMQRLTTKGPMLWPLLGIIPSLIANITRVYDWITDELSRAGGTFTYRGLFIGRYDGVMTCHPANIEHILKTRFTNFPKGNYYRERFADFLGAGIFNADGEVWKDQRRAATAEMHSSRFAEYSARTIRELVHDKLLRILEKVAESKGCVDLQDVFLRFTFDNICTAAFGVDPGCLAVDLPEVPFAKAFEQATELTLFRFLVPPFVWKSMKRLNVGSEKQLKIAIRTVHQFAEKTVSDRRIEVKKVNGRTQRSDLLSRLMETDDQDDTHLKDLCISFILAGRDTSSVALTWFFWLLHTHPNVENQIVNEINDIIKQTGNVVFSVDELKKMEYLQAALSESLRLYPSVPVDFKEVVEDDVLPDGTYVKKGTRVIYSIYSMARMESIWGKDCMEFRPERWIKDGMFKSENQFKYAVFNAGPRLCIGKKFAYMQMKMVAANILLRYHVEVVPGQQIAPKLNTTLYMKNGLQVRFRPREGGVASFY